MPFSYRSATPWAVCNEYPDSYLIILSSFSLYTGGHLVWSISCVVFIRLKLLGATLCKYWYYICTVSFLCYYYFIWIYREKASQLRYISVVWWGICFCWHAVFPVGLSVHLSPGLTWQHVCLLIGWRVPSPPVWLAGSVRIKQTPGLGPHDAGFS